MKIKGFDSYNVAIKKAEYDTDGFLIADVICSRTGIFVYKNEDGELENRLRHPDDVFKTESIKTLSMLPITIEHPENLIITAADAKSYTVGYSGETATIDGEHIKTRIKIIDADAIEIIKKGKRELSVGYEHELIDEIGMYNGEPYTKRIINLRYNHIAIVDEGRAGEKARIEIDKKEPITKTKGESRMYKVSIDGIEHEVENIEIAKHVKALESSVEQAKTAADSAAFELTKVTAERDAAKEELNKLKSVDHKEEIKKAVDERLNLERQVIGIMGNEFEVAGLDNVEMVTAVVKAKAGDSAVEGKPAEYIQARFDILAEQSKAGDKSDSKSTEQANAAAAAADSAAGDSVEDARKAMIAKRRELSSKK